MIINIKNHFPDTESVKYKILGSKYAQGRFIVGIESTSRYECTFYVQRALYRFCERKHTFKLIKVLSNEVYKDAN